MEAELTDLQDQIDQGTEHLLATISTLTDDDVRAPSLLPDWTRGHVVTHVARVGEALRNLLVWARTGVPIPPYVSQDARDADIAAGAGRSAAELLADVIQSAQALRAAAVEVPDEGWERTVGVPGSLEFPASQVLVRRLVEVELHHVDLGAGYRANDWPTRFVDLDLPEPMRSQRAERSSWPGGA
ncbi:maleylpyruvate isomerase N-terminal domain-containing protein [Actinopolymorpha rutila]|uniref:Maleylpyruvate isomerase n=1 Tax=Actinopolymorpha rutila TaxID=446787 RepID=A0A852Z210_9ACTN|nr:maleylpyruvate isomerase N-terminal domain-containing protein [Actinopolymorpha rutila]NYH87477.1 maleylpyruvate isomerase [Actinopolymorpha rutila]